MPKLLLFAPCEKVIVDDLSKGISLISLLEQVEGRVIKVAEEKVMAALPWTAFTMWLKTPEDEGKTYEPRAFVLQPDGTEIMAATAEFQLSQRSHRVINSFFGFPINQPGEHTVRLALRERGGNEMWVTMADYPILVIHKGETK